MTDVSLNTLLSLFATPQAMMCLRAAAETRWIEDAGCQYVTLTDDDVIGNLSNGEFPQDSVDIEFLCVTGALAPHVHQNSDTAVLVWIVDVDDVPEHWSNGEWELLRNFQIVDIPAGTPHGFRVGRKGKAFYALAIANPPIADGDTKYI